MHLSSYPFACFLIVSLLLSHLSSFGQTTLYDFDTEDLNGFTIFGATSSYSYSGSGGINGSGSLQFNTVAGDLFGGIFKIEDPALDLSSFNRIFFYAQASSDAGENTILIELDESGGEKWRQRIPFTPTSSLEKLSVNLAVGADAFTTTVADASLDLDEIAKVTLVFLPKAGNQALVSETYTIDEIGVEVVNIMPSLEVIPDSIDFNSPITPSSDNFRFSSETVSINYATPIGSSWEISAYTSNTDDVTGLVKVDDQDNVILDENGNPVTNPFFKVNRGAGGDEDNDAEWSGDAAVFSFIADDGASPGTIIISSSEDPSSGSYPVKFAVQVAGVVAGIYKTNVTFELSIL